jgi:hypothetical protein
VTDYLVKRTQYGTLEFYDLLEDDELIAALNEDEQYSGDQILQWLKGAFAFDIHEVDVAV